MPVDPVRGGHDTGPVPADEPHGVFEMRRILSDLAIRPAEILPPRRPENLPRRFRFLEPVLNGAVTAQFARRQVAQSDAQSESGMVRHDAAHADFEIIWVRPEDKEINRHGG
jgi:hypothetical protein